MAAPLFLLGLIPGAFGLKKLYDAKTDMDLAKYVNEQAADIAKEAEKKIEASQKSTVTAIENLGKQKIDVLSGSISDFVATFEKIKNIEVQESQGLDELKNFNPQSSDFLQLKKVAIEVSKIALNGLGAVGSGVLLAFGTYNVVMGGLGGLLVTATTGTTLTSLSGAAATNATLAWLGGGAIKAGGWGMLGGKLVLGGLVVGPALLIGGSLLAKEADKAYWDANANREKAKAFAEQAKGICSALKAIEDRATQLKTLLVKLEKPFVELIADMRSIVRNSGTDWGSYSDQDKLQIYKCVQLAQVIKMVLDTPLLNEDGKLLPESENSLQRGNSFFEAINL